MASGDWINACLLLVAVATLFWTALSVRRQAQASDFGSYLELTERYANAWRAFRDAEEGAKKEFEFVEVLNLIEGTCHLYNLGAIHGATREMIRDYLGEILRAMFRDEPAKERIQRSFSGPDTYFHIRRFARNNNIDGVWPDQVYPSLELVGSAVGGFPASESFEVVQVFQYRLTSTDYLDDITIKVIFDRNIEIQKFWLTYSVAVDGFGVETKNPNHIILSLNHELNVQRSATLFLMTKHTAPHSEGIKAILPDIHVEGVDREGIKVYV